VYKITKAIARSTVYCGYIIVLFSRPVEFKLFGKTFYTLPYVGISCLCLLVSK